MQYSRVLAACAVVLCASPALAQDDAWTGLYGGVQLDFTSVDLATPGTDITTNDGDGLMYGLTGGYRHDLGDIVLGAAATLTFGNFDTPPVTGATANDPSFGSMATVGIEAGYDLGELLVYAELGHTWATRSDAGNTRRFEGGWQYGIGADFMLNDQVIVGAGVTRTQLDDFGASDATVTAFGARAAIRF